MVKPWTLNQNPVLKPNFFYLKPSILKLFTWNTNPDLNCEFDILPRFETLTWNPNPGFQTRMKLQLGFEANFNPNLISWVSLKTKFNAFTLLWNPFSKQFLVLTLSLPRPSIASNVCRVSSTARSVLPPFSFLVFSSDVCDWCLSPDAKPHQPPTISTYLCHVWTQSDHHQRCY